MPLAASRAAALIQLLLVCASYEGRSRGLLEIRLRVLPAGRMKGMRHRWMRFEPYRPQAYFRTPEGIWRKDRRIGRIPFMRPATPRALTRFFQRHAAFQRTSSRPTARPVHAPDMPRGTDRRALVAFAPALSVLIPGDPASLSRSVPSCTPCRATSDGRGRPGSLLSSRDAAQRRRTSCTTGTGGASWRCETG